MDPQDKAERNAALQVIENEAQNLADNGADIFDVQGFVSGAQEELVKQSPDTKTYFKAAVTAKKAKK